MVRTLPVTRHWQPEPAPLGYRTTNGLMQFCVLGLRSDEDRLKLRWRTQRAALNCHLRVFAFSRDGIVLWPLDVERVDFLEPRVPQEEWASIRGHSIVGPEAAGMQAASLL